jgi:hypothetical protein
MSKLIHYRRIGLLIGLAILVQGWVVVRNPIPAQDAINFIQFARQLDHHSPIAVLQSNSQHPLFPVLVWGYHSILGWTSEGDGVSWIRSAQWVAAVASVLLVVPMYLTGVRLANRQLASAATAVFSVLPFAARMGADALSDSTYLLFMLMGIWGCAEFLESRRTVWLFLAGLSSGIGFLARPEALLLPPALAATLLFMQCRPVWRTTWSRILGGQICITAGLLCVATPYSLAVGKLTPKGSLNLLPGGTSLFAKFDWNHGRPVARTFNDGRPVPPAAQTSLLPPADCKLDFGLNHRPDEKRVVGYAGACRELGRELVEGLHYLIGLLVIVGMFFAQRRPANLLCSLLAAGFLIMLVQFASKSGYIASRHVLTLVCLACYIAARGGWVMSGWLARSVVASGRREAPGAAAIANYRGDGVARSPEDSPEGLLDSRRDSPDDSRKLIEMYQFRFAACLLVLATAFCLPRSLGPLHPSREAHVAAGRWLAEHAAAGSIVLDSRGWVSLYSGLPSYDYHGARLALENPHLAYVVVESSETLDNRPRGQTLRHLLGTAGEIVAEFPAPGVAGESVQVYAWHPDRLEMGRTRDASLRAN